MHYQNLFTVRKIAYICVLVSLLLTPFLSERASAQVSVLETFIDFRVNSSKVEPGFNDNANRLRLITDSLRHIADNGSVQISHVIFCGMASPEGSYEINKRLARERMQAVEKIVRGLVELPDSCVSYNADYIPWSHLAQMVNDSDISHKQEILSIIKGKSQIVDYHSGQKIDSRILKLKELDNGRVWQQMIQRFFAPMRNASVVITTIREPEPQELIADPVEKIDLEFNDTIDVELPAIDSPSDTVEVYEPDPIRYWNRRLYIKTNALGWALAITNVAGEVDLCRHLSFNLPIYYSAWNYFSSTVKFRTFTLQPELRYWFSEDNDGWFAGAHFGLGYYNIATGGEYRTQDHNGSSPALGGGVAIGYRLPISADQRWKIEFSAGAGVYRLHHDKFRNQPNGLLVYTEKKTHFGLDQLSVSIAYSFDLNRIRLSK